MREVTPGIHHWSAIHDEIGVPVHSYWMPDAGIVLDPQTPDEGLDAFADAPPTQVVLSSGLHIRHAQRFADAFGIPIRAPREAADRIGDRVAFEPYGDGDEIAPGVRAIYVGVLCPDEYALEIDVDGGALALADALMRHEGALGFVPDEHLGDDPETLKAGLAEQLRAVAAERDFAHLLLAHGEPIVGTGRDDLRAFLAG